ncbi:MAG TPA: response regulator transcription factor [Acidimicrobiales bacterium]|nr:response regulator transcription factor [Acidimicrobiales bacterium]
MPILLVEDDGRISSFLAKGLEAEGYSTVTARTVEEADGHIAAFGDDLDLVLLDLGLPAADGTDLLRRLRSRGSSVPVIILTARAELTDKVRGLDAGANDYVTKPFEFDELLARVRAALRSADHTVTSRLEVGDLTLDLLTKMASRAGRQIELAPREWALLELFMRHPTQIFSRAQILSRVWDYSFDPGSNVVDVYVGYIRRKLNRPGLSPLIQTVRGAGYRLLRPE